MCVCLDVYAHARRCPQKPEDGIIFLGAGVTGGCGMPADLVAGMDP